VQKMIAAELRPISEALERLTTTIERRESETATAERESEAQAPTQAPTPSHESRAHYPANAPCTREMRTLANQRLQEMAHYVSSRERKPVKQVLLSILRPALERRAERAWQQQQQAHQAES
jgi:hypothetical protein